MNYDKEKMLEQLGDKLRKEYKEVIVDFVIYDEDANQILVQKRSLTRNMFPGAWEFPGGHLEPNESLASCIKRLVFEEAQMYLLDIVDVVHIFAWDSDKDVVNIQCMVKASGTFTPNEDKISEHRFIDKTGMKLLVENGQESQIYRGAYYAFEYIKLLQNGSTDGFESVVFFDQVVTGFLNFIRSEELAPKVTLGKEEDKKFALDKAKGTLSIAPSFLKHYDEFACAWIILHLVFHNYRQGISAYDDVRAIRALLGKNVMFSVDIAADAYTFLFFERYYGFTLRSYLQLCHRLIKEYQDESLENSKLTRLLGAALTIASREGQGFDIHLPVLDEKTAKLYVVRFNRGLSYQTVSLDKNLKQKCKELAVKATVSEKDFLKTIEAVISLVKEGK